MKGVEVTDEMLDSVGDMQMVETVTLLSGGPYNGFTCAPSALCRTHARAHFRNGLSTRIPRTARAGTSTCMWTTLAR